MPGILFIDTETTGIPKFNRSPTAKGQPYIVQLAAILADEAGQISAEFCHVIRPQQWKVPPGAERVHGISTERARAEGIPIADALDQLDQLVAQSDTIVAHNVDFDVFLLRSEYDRAQRTTTFLGHTKRCTMKETSHLVGLPNPQRPGQFKWPTLAEAHRFFVGTTFAGAHDALADARACAAIYFKWRAEMTRVPPNDAAPRVAAAMGPPANEWALLNRKLLLVGIVGAMAGGWLFARCTADPSTHPASAVVSQASAHTAAIPSASVAAGGDASMRSVSPKHDSRKPTKVTSPGAGAPTPLPPLGAASSSVAPGKESPTPAVVAPARSDPGY